MDSIIEILKKEMEKSEGTAKIVKVPKNMRPTAESLKKMDRKIRAQIQENEKWRI